MIIKAKMNLRKHYKRLQPQNKWLEKFAFCPPSLQLFVKRKGKKNWAWHSSLVALGVNSRS